MNDNSNKKNLQNASDAELKSEIEKRMENKCETWGSNIETKIDDFTGKLPAPVSTFLDALCISVSIAGVVWIFEKLNWINDILSWGRVSILFCSVLVISLIYRLLIKPRHKKP